MKKGISQIIKVQTSEKNIVDMSIVEKQSDLGIMFNERLLILIQEYSFGYLKGFKYQDQPRSIDTSKCKTLVPLKNIVGQPEKFKNTLGINFFINQNGKKVSKKWVFKLANQVLTNQWFELFKIELNKIQIKKQQKSKRSGQKSPKKSPLSSNTQIQQQRVTYAEAQQSKLKQQLQLKKDFVKNKSDKNINKQYENQLYQTQKNKQGKKQQKSTSNFILEPDPPQIKKKLQYNQQDPSKSKRNNFNQINHNNQAKQPNKINQPSKVNNQGNQPYQGYQGNQGNQGNQHNQGNELEKSNNQRVNENKAKQAQMEKKRYQQQKLRRQKEQLLRKQQELKQRERRIQQQQARIQQQKRRMKHQQQMRQKNENEGPKQAVINEKFFHKGKPQPNKQVSPSINTPKTKPKLQGINYSEIVNKININKNKNDQAAEMTANKKLEETHQYLLEQQRKKMNNSKINKYKHNQKQPIQQKQYINSNPYEDDNNQVPKQFGWTYRFLLSQQQNKQHQIIKQFNEHCENIIKKVVQQFHLPERKRTFAPKFKNQDYFSYQVDDLQFKIAFIALKQFYNKNGPQYLDRICDQKTVKKFQNQFKNFHSLFKIIKQTKVKLIKVPLCCVCQYQGFIALFKARSQFQNQNNLTIDKKTQIDLQKISEKLQMKKQFLLNKQNVLLLKLNNKYYRQVASRTKRLHSNFDYIFVQQIKKLMPADVLFSASLSQQNPQKVQQNQNIYNVRPQHLMNYNFRNQNENQISQTILQSLRKSSNYKPPKKSSLETSNIYLQKLSYNILVPITQIVKLLNDLDFYFIHPKQIQTKLHQNGVNIRYLGLIYDNCNLKFQKCYLMSEIAARVCKALFRKTIQDVNIQQTEQIIQNSYSQNMRMKIIDFLNCILGSTVETVTIWKLLSAYSINFFNVPLILEEIQRGYFVQSLIYHCGIDVDWTRITMSSAFVANQFFSQDNFIGINVKIKGYEIILDQKQRQFIQKMEQQQPSVFKFLEQQLKLQNNPLPEKFKSEKYINIFRKYLVNFVPPDFGGQRGYKLLNLYSNMSGYSTKTQMYLKFMQLKWYLKRQRKEKYINAFNNINHQVTSNFSDFHPLLSQLYDIMCIYHQNNGQFQDAITFSKSSVINMLKVCGTTHPKVGQCYYQLATCCIKGGKKDQAIISLQKAKNIFEANQQQYNLSYANVCLKLGLLFLSESKTKQTQNIIKYAQQLFEYHEINNKKMGIQQNYQEERLQCYQILARCYQLQQLAQLQLDLSLQCQKQIVNIKSPNTLERYLKIILSPILGSLKSNDASTYLDIISQIPLQISVNTYMKGYQRISQRVQQNTLIQSLESYLQNLSTIESFIKQHKTLSDWKGLTQQNHERQTVDDFISLTQQLIYYLGQGFITGSIRDSL